MKPSSERKSLRINSMIKAIEQKTVAPRIPFCARNGILFFNCTQETIDKAVENDNRRKAYLGIGEWGDEEGDTKPGRRP